MNEIARLLDAGYGVMFERWHDGRAECTLTTPTGDVVTALGDTPAAALAEASPLEPEGEASLRAMVERIAAEVKRAAHARAALTAAVDGLRGELRGSMHTLAESAGRVEGKLEERVAKLEAASAGDGRAVLKPHPWMMAADGSAWTCVLPDGQPASIERLKEGDDDGNGAAFLPRVGDVAGPVCDGITAAATWIEKRR